MRLVYVPAKQPFTGNYTPAQRAAVALAEMRGIVDCYGSRGVSTAQAEADLRRMESLFQQPHWQQQPE